MSLFPAYGADGKNSKANVVNATEQQQQQEQQLSGAAGASFEAKSAKWQSNPSFELPNEVAVTVTDAKPDSESDSKSVSQSDSESESASSKAGSEGCSANKRPLEFASNVEFYVDKSSNKVHLEWQTLPRLSRPRYKIQMRRLADAQRPRHHSQPHKKRKRHASKLLSQKSQAIAKPSAIESITASSSRMERIRELKIAIGSEPQQLDSWLELHRLLGENVSKSNRLAVAEQQLHQLETALDHHHPGNERLLQLYVETTSATYPDSQVATKIEELLRRTPYEYTLWTALIMSTQGTMARCNVPDVLQLYEQCMRRMHLGPKDQGQQTDELMLKLYHNCVLFLRQSANLEQMFALLRLALELNFPRTDFVCFAASVQDEQPLLDYEELVLRSGMPMPEIWTRIERLRQAYQFLPYPQQQQEHHEHEQEQLDPQRCVYSSDVCHYIYPLKERANTLHLLLLTVQLTKLPLVRSNSLADRLAARISQIGDSDAIEMLLGSLGDRLSYALPPERDGVYWSAVLELSRQLCVSPSYMPHTIGFELYQRCVAQLLLQCSNAFDDDDDNEPKRRIFIVLSFRFRRLCLRLLQLCGKQTDRYVASTRKAMRQLLIHQSNRCVTRFFTELAMFDFEALADKTSALQTLQRLIKGDQDADADADTDLTMDVDRLHALLICTEMMIGQQRGSEALQLLNSSLPHGRQLLDDALRAEPETETDRAMPLEDYFVPDRLLLLLRLHCLQLHLDAQTMAAEQLLEQLLQQPRFALETSSDSSTSNSSYCCHRREQLRELQLLLLQLAGKAASQRLVGFLEESLVEFPRNLALLQRWSSLASLPWYKLRMRLMHTRAGILSLLHLVLAARCRCVEQQQQQQQQPDLDEHLHSRAHLQQLLQNRLLSIFETLLPTNPHRTQLEAEQYAILRRNSLYWRLYLRTLSTEQTSFERSKRCLLMALDECPWDKALYMDGVTYVPQELANLQDVMMEKQLRIYAIPEELNVLRDA
ncbi:uncharacterized protein LOC6569228 [Drosophila grimshawi]|uniref:GH17615 n=1 Tax=Drosophila grimshawi TaxID=7222 RepID=B4JX86_DROGR|nr:uncharacterized protein LOC6569228 [Drosophila grimshawi]XP_032597344.1 uncharacterized protein LOC6569228 [Drosophila grimshawi]EDV95362.1 GH17615 [Drosophila grimshawi]